MEVIHEKGWKQGLYVLVNPEKYLGNKDFIRYMSGWEKEMHRFLDYNEDVLQWCSEPIAIPYIKPTDGQVHKYIPDYYVKYRDKYGKIREEILEVKPRSQCVLREGMSQTEMVDFAINQAKWKYAREWCAMRGLGFTIISETPKSSKKQSFRGRKIKKLRAR